MASAQCEGTLVRVAHERHLLRATTDQFIILANGKLQPFDGDPDDDKAWLFKTRLATKANAVGTALPPIADNAASVIAPALSGKKNWKRTDAEERQNVAARKKP
ncbi:ATPase subunit of ABC transporter with duplicated ATPase domains [Actimicrobium sp. GrIS 1.19]|uniref:hypothetical protein n=1 Tax=Actimicrobium sp. GrIS 1.19 TaxID=3071708 RepID=UPI002DF9140D|nr:ATPase subunit of ABC transporter with duplicated ATPase domains [Actimicrobium sp. GrIS 1.19]